MRNDETPNDQQMPKSEIKNNVYGATLCNSSEGKALDARYLGFLRHSPFTENMIAKWHCAISARCKQTTIPPTGSLASGPEKPLVSLRRHIDTSPIRLQNSISLIVRLGRLEPQVRFIQDVIISSRFAMPFDEFHS